MGKTLFHIFLWLIILSLAVFGFSYFFHQKTSKPFESRIIRFQSGEIQNLDLKMPGKEPIHFTNTENGWVAVYNQISVPVANSFLQLILHSLDSLESKGIRSESKMGAINGEDDKTWTVELNLSDKSGKNQKIILRTPVTNQQGGIATTDGNIYELKTFPYYFYNANFDVLRNHIFTSYNPETIKKISFNIKDSTFTLSKIGSIWQTPDQEWDLDTTNNHNIIKLLSQINANIFADHFDKDELRDDQIASLVLYSLNNDSITIKAYQPAPEKNEIILESSQNPDNLFISDAGGIYTHIFDIKKNIKLKPSAKQLERLAKLKKINSNKSSNN